MRYRILTCSLLVAAISGLQTADAQRRGGGFGFGGGSLESSAVRLATMEPMKAELKLNDEQVKKLSALATELQENSRGLFSRDAFEGLNEEERNKKIAEIREKMESLADANAKKAKEILKPEQLARLKEIAFQQRIQFGIANVFRVDEFAEAAKITDEQKKKVEQLGEEMQAEAEKVSDDRREQFQWRLGDGAKKYEPKFEAILTAEQKSVLGKMKGKEYDVASLRPQRRGGQRGGTRPGGGNRDGGDRPGGRPQRPQRPTNDN